MTYYDDYEFPEGNEYSILDEIGLTYGHRVTESGLSVIDGGRA